MPQIVQGPPPDPGALYIEAKKAHGVPETLSCDAKAFVEAPENAGRYALHVSVKRPVSIRIEALTPMGDPAAVLVADQGRFALLDLRNNVFYRGPATPENLSRLIPAPLRDEELVALITGDIPELPGGRPDTAARDGDGYRRSCWEAICAWSRCAGWTRQAPCSGRWDSTSTTIPRARRCRGCCAFWPRRERSKSTSGCAMSLRENRRHPALFCSAFPPG